MSDKLATNLRLHTFAVDVTPPTGDYLCGGLHGRSTGVESHLWLRGMIFDTGDMRCIIASIDFCYLAGRSHARLVDAIASAANISESQVTVHSTHAHDAPLIDEEAHGILQRYGHAVHNEAGFQELLAGAHQSVSLALKGNGVRVAAIAASQHPVHEFAGNRRIIGTDGKCLTRWSICGNPAIRDAPCGTIDPALRQVILFNEQNTAIAAIHCYACHPQVSDGRGLISSDAPGRALGLFNSAYPGVFSIYFTGCAGDITGGKFTTRNKVRNQILFGNRLFDAMDAAFLKADPHPFETLRWSDRVFHLPLTPVTEPLSYWEDRMRSPGDGEQPVAHAYLAAMKAQRLAGKIHGYPFRLSRLSLNGVDLLFCPSELLLEYQRFAQSLKPQVMVVAYGDSFLKYVAPASCFAEGGYEVESLWTEVGPDAEPIIKDHIRAVLKT